MKRRDQVAHAAAGLDHRPVAGRNDEVQAFAVDRDAASAAARCTVKSAVRSINVRHHELADRHGEEQEQRAGRQRPRDRQPNSAGTHSTISATSANCVAALTARQFAQQPQQARRRHRQQQPGLRPRRQAGQPSRWRQTSQNAIGGTRKACVKVSERDPDGDHRSGRVADTATAAPPAAARQRSTGGCRLDSNGRSASSYPGCAPRTARASWPPAAAAAPGLDHQLVLGIGRVVLRHRVALVEAVLVVQRRAARSPSSS